MTKRQVVEKEGDLGEKIAVTWFLLHFFVGNVNLC